MLLENGVLKICSKFAGGNDDDHDYDDYEELFCVMVDRRKAFSLVRDLHHRESLTHCEQDLNLRRTRFRLVELNCAVMIITTPRRQ